LAVDNDAYCKLIQCLCDKNGAKRALCFIFSHIFLETCRRRSI